MLWSSDFGDQSSLLPSQATKELVSSAGGTSESVLLQACSSPPPAASIVCVNILWLLSLVLSIMSALFVTLKPQRANQYLRLPKVTLSVMLLHLSIFLFLVGLVIFFYKIYTTVAFVGSLIVGLFVMVYFLTFVKTGRAVASETGPATDSTHHPSPDSLVSTSSSYTPDCVLAYPIAPPPSPHRPLALPIHLAPRTPTSARPRTPDQALFQQ